jgi:hypothetical protein
MHLPGAEPAQPRKRRSRNKDKEEPAVAGSVPKAADDPKSQAADKPAAKSAKQERKRLRRSEKRKEAEQGTPAIIVDSEEDMVDLSAPLTKDEASFLTNLGVTPALQKVEISKLFAFPMMLEASDCAEKAVQVASGGKTNSKELEDAQSNVSLYQQMVDDHKAVPGRAHLSGVLETQLKEWKAKLAKLSENKAGSQTGGKAALSDLRAKRTSEEAKEDQRMLVCEGKAKTARARYDRLRLVLVSEQNKLAEKLVAFDAQFVKVQEAWSTDATSRATFYKQKLAAWDSRIAAIAPLGGADDLDPDAAANVVQAAISPAAPPANPAADPAPQADYFLSTKWNLSEIPMAGKPANEKDAEGLTILHHNLRCWTQCGMIPMTFEQIFSGCENTDSILVSRALLGEGLWKRLYGERQITQLHLVPIQVVTMLQTALGKLENECTADEKRTKIIQAKFDMFYDKDQVDKMMSRGAYGECPY